MPLQLNERIVFVVGKGGVGKSTAACAIALAAADQQHRTHLLSTDPAHSIADILEEHADLRVPTRSACSPVLTAEAFDAAAYAHALFETARPALALLVEQGTYLDAADAHTFLDLSLPGVDEIMSALRIAELSETEATRIVIDTAPTGHALRLLDASRVLDGWIAALRAMTDKAGAVASALIGRDVRLPAENLIEDWDRRMRTFERVLAHAGFVVVTREGAAVEAETDRLVKELQRRGLRHAATVVTAPTCTHSGQVAVPWLATASGCVGLRSWWSEVGPVREERLTRKPDHDPRSGAGTVASLRATPPRIALSDGAGQDNVRDWLVSRTPATLVFAGKGGVGKSTCAAAVALLAAKSTPTRLVSTDPAGSLGDVLEADITSTARQIAGVTAVQIDAAAEFERVRAEYGAAVERVFAQLGLGRAALLDRRVLQSLWDMAPPGIDEIMAVGHLMNGKDPEPRRVVDAAPTGHFLNLLAMPAAGLEWTHALLRVLLKYNAVTALEDATREVLELARQLRVLRERLSDPARTGVILVSLDESVVWSETRRLHESLAIANIPVAALILNRADAGPARGLPPLNPQPRIIRAPIFPAPTGRERLLEFVATWEFLDR